MVSFPCRQGSLMVYVWAASGAIVGTTISCSVMLLILKYDLKKRSRR